MGNRFRIRAAFQVAWIEYIKWVTNPRMIILGVFLVFMKGLAIDPLLERAEKMNGTLCMFEPFIAVGNSGMLVLLMPCVFLILLGDYPILNDGMLYMVYRSKKTNWFLGQVLFLIFAIFTFLGIVCGISMLLSGGSFGFSWSDTVTKYQSVYPDEAGNFASQLLPSNLYNQLSLSAALSETFFLFALYLFLLALMLYLFRLLKMGPLGMAVSCLILGMGVVTCSVKQTAMWLFPMAHVITWIHYEEIFRKQVFPVWGSFLYFGIGVIVLFAGNLFVLRKLQFTGGEIS